MNESLPREITKAEIETFEQDGAVCLRGMFDADWVERMRRAIDRVYGQGQQFMKMNPDGTPGRFYFNLYMWSFDQDFRALAFESPAAQLAAKLLRSRRINLISETLFSTRTLIHLMPHPGIRISRTGL
jgi:hypothetical protein